MPKVIRADKGPKAGPAGAAATLREKREAVDDNGFMSFDSLWDFSQASGVLDPMLAMKRKREEAEKEIDELLRKAREEATRIEREAYEKGYAQGEKDGLAIGGKKLEVAARQFEGLLRELQRQRQDLHKQYEQDMISLVKLMTERLTYHQVAVQPEVIHACLQAAMAFVVESSAVRVHLSPGDFSQLRESAVQVRLLEEGSGRIELVEDPGIASGGCLLETDFGEVDATLESRRQRLYEALDKAYAERIK